MSKMLGTLQKIATKAKAEGPPPPSLVRDPVKTRAPDPSGESEKTFPELKQTEYVVRWGLPFEPAPERWKTANSGHVLMDDAGEFYVVDANDSKEYRLFKLEDVVLLQDDNTPHKEV